MADPRAPANAVAPSPDARSAPFVDAETLTRLLTPQVALQAIQDFFSRHARDGVFIPERIHLHIPGAETIGLYMPAATSQYIGIKLAHLMPQRTPNVEAEIFFYDARTGRLLFWGDGKPITGLRTAALSAAGALRLLPECRRLVVFGNGVQAAAHIVAFAQAYPHLERVDVVTRKPEAMAQLKARLPDPLAARVLPVTDLQKALRQADCIITTTPAPQPIFDAADLPERCHIAAVGSAAPSMNELPAGVFRTAQVWTDTRSALRESGDCLAAMAAGWRDLDLAGDAFDLLGSHKLAPTPPRTLFKTVGHASQDLALLLALAERLPAVTA